MSQPGTSRVKLYTCCFVCWSSGEQQQQQRQQLQLQLPQRQLQHALNFIGRHAVRMRNGQKDRWTDRVARGAGKPIHQQRLHFCFIRLVVFGPNGIIDCPTVHSATVEHTCSCMCVCYEICIWPGLPSSYYLLIDGCAAININRGNCQNGNELGKLCELQHVEYDLSRCVVAS